MLFGIPQSEDEALARALALSLQESQQNGSISNSADQQMHEDLMLARAIAESERQQRQGTSSLSRDRCSVS